MPITFQNALVWLLVLAMNGYCRISRHRLWYKMSRENCIRLDLFDKCGLCRTRLSEKDKKSEGFLALLAPEYRKKKEQK